jgi:predicted RNase H-like HicB family nuclease
LYWLFELELPTVFGDGDSAEKCIENTREALAVAVAYLMEENKKPPTPARMGKRTQQVNVRLTAEERAVLEAVAKKRGFQGLSDFIRAVALESVG